MNYKTKVSKRGSIKIPSEILKDYGLNDGDLLHCTISNKMITLMK